jgi:hypothetical protein
MLLGGYPLFWDDSQPRMLRMIKAGIFCSDDPMRELVSSEAKDLISEWMTPANASLSRLVRCSCGAAVCLACCLLVMKIGCLLVDARPGACLRWHGRREGNCQRLPSCALSEATHILPRLWRTPGWLEP